MVDILPQVQCNVFEGATGEVALTAAGGLRQLPGLTENFENAALVLNLGIQFLFQSCCVFSYIHFNFMDDKEILLENKK